MRIVHQLQAWPIELRGAAVALGNFDGVHVGHRAVIQAAGRQARTLAAPLAVVTFEPHPRQLFRPEAPLFRLTPLDAKARLIAGMGADGLLVLPFDRAFSQLTAEAFVQNVLVDGMAVRHVTAGHDFRFGNGRAGDDALLARMGAMHGFSAEEVGPVTDGIGQAISSTRIRDLLQEGQPAAAAQLLGAPFEITGLVEHGDKRGRTIGVPTANLSLGEHLRPRFGVYAVQVGLTEADGSVVWRQGVANIGHRPTVGGLVERLEVHVFDFERDLYGQSLRVQLHHFLRPEEKFSDFAALRTQIAQDLDQARAALA